MGIAGLVGGLGQAKEQKSLARVQAGQQQQIYEAGEARREAIGRQVSGEAQIAQQQLRAAEQARFNVMGLLGAPGTYDMPTARPTGPFSYSPLGLGAIRDTGVSGGGVLTSGRQVTLGGEVTREDVGVGDITGISKGRGKWLGSAPWEAKGEVLDPDVLTSQITGTAGFRTVSRMVAESEQLVNRSGPLWDELNNSVTGGIFQSSAAMQRQMMEDLSREMARGGGTARNSGMRMANAMRVQEKVNTERMNLLFNSKLQLETFIKDNAANVMNMSNAWVSNQAGIRDNFTSTLTNLTTFWSQVMPPNLIAAQGATQQQMASNVFNAGNTMMQAINTKYNAIISGTNSIVGGIMNPAKSMMPSGGEGGVSGMLMGGIMGG